MDTIEKKINELGPALRSLSLQIHSHPELMFEERFAHDKLTKFMSSHGFTVTKHYLGLETAWRAEWSYGKGGRILGVNSEMDALPGIGHACGHNLIAIAGVGIAIAVKAALKKHNVPGKVVLLGTPAEEGGTGKIILLERGGYKDMAACIMCHPTIGPVPNQWAGVKSSLSVQSIEAEYFGHTAHASAAPWEGTNALDAAFLAYTNISALRQQMKPDHRVHGVITGKDTMAANVIPDYTKMTWLVRAPSWKEVEVLRERVLACLQAASLATACKMKITLGKGMYDLRHTPVLADEFAKTMGERYGWVTDFGKNERGASTDFGNITYAMPALHPVFAIPTKPLQGNHTPGFTAAAASEGAHSATLTMVKALALVGFRVLDDEEYFRKVRKSFEEMF
ncbi:hypothetical protein JAAARDRAFT_61149 [Jaapia argillacea MUCL 33604]|uniref:Peptidase M20 domain-containing protein 2 n=1 Tax=Jaapia argillacea MUCL 33604 TaxID=933084 RepID=A0A067PFT9_9AGAM|nr:hypothetical protein JAAARDRAFT_61149 [Jaapia argillacea MUCL 33604]